VLEAQIKRRPAMKKVSTAAAQASRNISQQTLTVQNRSQTVPGRLKIKAKAEFR
jgi:hypothetical protein